VAYDNNLHKREIIVVIRAFIDHYVLIRAISCINFQWGDLPNFIMKLDKPLVYLFANLGDFKCIYLKSKLVETQISEETLKILTIGFWIMLINLFLLCTRGFRYFRDRTISTMLITIWICFPEALHVIYQSISCKIYDGAPRLYKDLEMICWQGAHLDQVYNLTIPSMFVWLLVFPIIINTVIKRNR
jgi:hypothetical protein